MSTRLIFKEISIENDKIVVSKASIIDAESGEEIRIAKPTLELISLLSIVEIELDDYFHIQEMKKKNPNFTKLINTFKLYN